MCSGTRERWLIKLASAFEIGYSKLEQVLLASRSTHEAEGGLLARLDDEWITRSTFAPPAPCKCSVGG